MILSESPKITLLNMDCMVHMAEIPDGYYDLAVVDPPYGINHNNGGGRYEKWNMPQHKWDEFSPAADYFKELFRASTNQIIWGANHYEGLPATNGFIFWYKQNPVPNFSDGEYAWTSFQVPAKCFDFRFYGNLEGKTNAESRIHPTQKPIALYRWLLTNYAKAGDKIFDSHLGSGSSAIAAHQLGFDFTGTELDKEYYDASVKRFKLVTSQQRINFKQNVEQ